MLGRVCAPAAASYRACARDAVMTPASPTSPNYGVLTTQCWQTSRRLRGCDKRGAIRPARACRRPPRRTDGLRRGACSKVRHQKLPIWGSHPPHSACRHRGSRNSRRRRRVPTCGSRLACSVCRRREQRIVDRHPPAPLLDNLEIRSAARRRAWHKRASHLTRLTCCTRCRARIDGRRRGSCTWVDHPHARPCCTGGTHTCA